MRYSGEVEIARGESFFTLKVPLNGVGFMRQKRNEKYYFSD
jgi:hypothetical protein